MTQPRGSVEGVWAAFRALLSTYHGGQVVSYLRPLTFYQNLDVDFRIGMDLREHLLQPSVFGPGGCDCRYF